KRSAAPDLRRVVPEERAPGLARRPSRPPPAMASDGAGADGDPQLAELAADALGAPQGVVPRHPGDQVAHLAGHAWAPDGAAGAPPPVEPPAAAVPPEHGLRPHEDEVPAPVGAEAAGSGAEQPVAPPEPRARAGAEGDGQLLPEEQVLQQQRVAVVKR